MIFEAENLRQRFVDEVTEIRLLPFKALPQFCWQIEFFVGDARKGFAILNKCELTTDGSV